MLTSFSYSRFRWLWFSNLAGAAGRWTLVLVLSLQLLQMTHSSFWVGLGLFLTQGPVILLAPFSGALADRFDRRTLNLLSSLVLAGVTAIFGGLSWARVESLALWMALALLFGLAFVAQMTIRPRGRASHPEPPNVPAQGGRDSDPGPSALAQGGARGAGGWLPRAPSAALGKEQLFSKRAAVSGSFPTLLTSPCGCPDPSFLGPGEAENRPSKAGFRIQASAGRACEKALLPLAYAGPA